jgi:acetoin utilization deacetylase AcuC-like enzyme
VSTHQYPFYPGTGASDEIGRGDGVGATINIPLPAGCGDDEYAVVFDELVLPRVRQFKPDVILMSAGFDAHIADPLASMRLTTRGYAALAQRMCRLADEVAGGRLVAVLEGGYNLEGLAGGVVEMVRAMIGEGADAGVAEDRPDILPGARRAIDETRRALEGA